MSAFIHRFPIRRTASICLAIFGLAAQPLRADVTGDVIQLASGKEVQARVSGLDGEALTLIRKTQYGVVTERLPLDQVRAVKFADEERLAADLPKLTDRARLEQLWNARKPFLPIPESMAGAVGLRFARVLLDSTKPADAQLAEGVLDDVEEKDWSKPRRADASGLRFEALLKSGDEATALARAEEALARKDQPRMRSDASYFLANRAINEFLELLAENPRWSQDPFVRPERDRLYYTAIDLLLIPYLEDGSSPETASRSVWRLSEFYAEAGETEAARSSAQDVVTIFSSTPEAKLAEKYLTTSEKTEP